MKTAKHSLKFLIFMLLFTIGATIFTVGVGAQDEGWQIMRADYGFRAQRTDVTDILRDLVSRGNEEREFDVNEGGFVDAHFFVVRRDDSDDRRRDERGRDDRPRDDHDRGDRGEAHDLLIIRGFYGVQGRTVNVTEQLRAMVRDGVLAVRVNNENFGGDPAIGADKVLIVIYSFHGQEQATAVREGNRLVIP